MILYNLISAYFSQTFKCFNTIDFEKEIKRDLKYLCV